MAVRRETAGDDYILRRGFAASARLNLMHYLWREHVGYLIHPRIAANVDLESSPSIAEIGTGTGIWLLDLARSLPSSVKLDGFDISLAQCPAAGWLPHNVTMSVLDSLESLPEHLVGKYDVVHVRHFLLVVKNNDPSALIQNIAKMLKPGGYVQWGEVDFRTLKFVTADSEGTAAPIEELWRFMRASSQRTSTTLKSGNSWTATLDDALRAQGMVNVSMDRFDFDRSYLPANLDTALLTWEELVYMVVDRIGEDEGKQGRDLIAKAYEAGNTGAATGVVQDKVAFHSVDQKSRKVESLIADLPSFKGAAMDFLASAVAPGKDPGKAAAIDGVSFES